ncbi:hypothetical protein JCM16358_25810 [Halanaerocella petrolearia]
MLVAVNKYQRIKGSGGNMKDLLISVGCLVIKNYAQIILKYNDKLSSELKGQLTLLVNNLQICSQLQSRISGLEEGINESEDKLVEIDNDLEKEKKITKRKERLNNSLQRKQKKLSQLNQENINCLIKIGKQFYEQRLLQDDEEFNNLYKQLDFLVNNREKVCEKEELAAEEININVLNLNNLLPV